MKIGSQRKEDMVQVLESPLYHHPKITKTGTHPCDLYQFPLASGALPAKGCSPMATQACQGMTWHLCLPWSWEHYKISSVSLPLCKLTNPEPRCPGLYPCKALKKPVQALRTGRREQLGSHTAGRWDIHSCACHTWYRLPCGHTPAEHSQWVSPCRSYTGFPPVQMALLPLYKHTVQTENGQKAK